jgi:phosphate transport system permease protein
VSDRFDGDVVAMTLERYDELGMRYSASGDLSYFSLANGEVLETVALPIPEGVDVVSTAMAEPRARRAAYGLADGTALVIDHQIRLDFQGDERRVLPDPQFPLGEEPLVIDPEGRALVALAVQKAGEDTGIAAQTDDGRLLLVRFRTRTAFLTGETEVTRQAWTLPAFEGRLDHLQLTANLWTLIGADESGRLVYFDISNPASAVLRDEAQATEDGERLTELRMLNGTFSWVIGTSEGRISQWFLVRDKSDDAGDNVFRLTRVRDFEPHAGAITRIQPEYTRKGFAAVDDTGALGLHYGTSARTMFLEPVSDGPLVWRSGSHRSTTS